MPIYDYTCPVCQAKFTRYLKLADYRTEQFCSCGERAQRVICAPAVHGDFAGYECPITGDWIEGRRAHEENLKKHGKRLLEPGEQKDFLREKQAEEDAFCDRIAESAAQYAAALPQRKQEQLATELSNSTLEFTRTTKGM